MQALTDVPVFDDGASRDTPAEPEQDDQAPDPAPDPGAPWGVNPKTGRPYARSPEERRAWGEKMTLAREKAREAGMPGERKAPPRKRGARTASTSRRSEPEGPVPLTTEQKIAGLLALPAMALAVAGRFWPTLRYDSLALSRGIPDLAAVAAMAVPEYPQIMAAIDRAAEFGPWGGVAMAGAAVGLQILANHKIIDVSPELGILTLDELDSWAKGPQ